MNLPNGYFLQTKKYQLTHTIGQGGFGITYLGVWNTEVKGELGAMKTKIPVCIKEYFFKDYCYRDKGSYAVNVHSETGEKLFGKFKEKLIKEANILSAVHHSNIVNVLEVFEENNTAYIIMEYIKGCSLKYMLDKEGVLSENKVLKYVHQIGNALDFVHNKNIVHLDIKPGNILIDREDNARLIDFGVSKRYDIEEQETSTTTLTLSKGFASIEQYDDEGTLIFSPCPDIYSLGATMYNLLTGVIPVESILRATKQMLPPSSYNSNITPKTENAVLKAMEVKPEDRFQVVKELLGSIDIPPYELTENTLVESDMMNDDDFTEVLGTHRQRHVGTADDDDDRTIITSSATSNNNGKPPAKKKTKRRVLMTTSILLCAVIGYAVYSYVIGVPIFSNPFVVIDMPGDTTNNSNIALINNVSDANDPYKTSGSEQIPTTTQQDTTLSQNDSTTNNSVVNNNQPQTTPENIKPSNTKPEITTVSGNTEPVTSGLTDAQKAEQRKKAQNLKTSAEAKMKQDNYEGANNDLKNAYDIAYELNIRTLTDEIETLRRTCEEKLKEKEINEKLDKYDIYDNRKIAYNIVVARNKETKLFGAINPFTGEIIIECIYKSSDVTDNGEAFLREDGLVDIYNDKGRISLSGAKRSN